MVDPSLIPAQTRFPVVFDMSGNLAISRIGPLSYDITTPRNNGIFTWSQNYVVDVPITGHIFVPNAYTVRTNPFAYVLTEGQNIVMNADPYTLAGMAASFDLAAFTDPDFITPANPLGYVRLWFESIDGPYWKWGFLNDSFTFLSPNSIFFNTGGGQSPFQIGNIGAWLNAKRGGRGYYRGMMKVAVGSNPATNRCLTGWHFAYSYSISDLGDPTDLDIISFPVLRHSRFVSRTDDKFEFLFNYLSASFPPRADELAATPGLPTDGYSYHAHGTEDVVINGTLFQLLVNQADPNRNSVDTDVHSERIGYWIAEVDLEGVLTVKKGWHTDRVAGSDGNNGPTFTGSLHEPRLSVDHHSGQFSLLVHSNNDVRRAFSYDYGETWKEDGNPYKAGVSHGVELFLRRNGYRLFFYRSGNIQVDRYDAANTFIDTVDVSTPLVPDDCSFGVWEPENDVTSYIRVAFLSAQIQHVVQSYDDGETWVTIF